MNIFTRIFGGGLTIDKTSGPTCSRSELDAIKLAGHAIESLGGPQRAWLFSSWDNGDSMLPLIPQHCYVVMELCSKEEVRLGDVIQFLAVGKGPSQIILHRVVRLHPQIRTKGMNATLDRGWEVGEVDGRMADSIYFDPDKRAESDKRRIALQRIPQGKLQRTA